MDKFLINEEEIKLKAEALKCIMKDSQGLLKTEAELVLFEVFQSYNKIDQMIKLKQYGGLLLSSLRALT